MPSLIHPAWNSGYTQPPVGARLNRAHPLARGLIGAWIFNGGSDTYVPELVNRKDITSAILQTGAGISTNRSSRGMAFNCPLSSNNGTGTTLQVPDDPLYVNLYTGPLSIACWVFFRSGPGSFGVFLQKGSGGPSHGWLVGYDDSTQSLGFKIAADTAMQALTANNTVPPNQWRHLVVSYQGSGGSANQFAADVAIYLEGTLMANATAINGSAATPDVFTDDTLTLKFGGDANGASFLSVSCVLESVYLWKRALSAGDASALYRQHYQIFQPAFVSRLAWNSAIVGRRFFLTPN